MNPIELKCARIRRGKTTREMAEAIGNSMAAYNLRERGVCPVTLEDAKKLGPALGLSEEEFFMIFFDGDIPYRRRVTQKGESSTPSHQREPYPVVSPGRAGDKYITPRPAAPEGAQRATERRADRRSGMVLSGSLLYTPESLNL